jgi:hypothetical protein
VGAGSKYLLLQAGAGAHARHAAQCEVRRAAVESQSPESESGVESSGQHMLRGCAWLWLL